MDAAPIDRDQRFDSLDVLRGVAVLGILLLNVIGFGLPYAYEHPTVHGGVEPGRHDANFWAWLVPQLLFEGTMRGLFTLLFGAGVVLFVRRLEAVGPPAVPGAPTAADLHVRRMLWLVAFGLVNSHLLLWYGDILFEYGVVGLVLYAFRNLRPRTLVLVALALYAALTVRGELEFRGLQAQRDAAVEAQALERAGATLPDEQRAAIEAWAARLSDDRPPPERVAESIAAMRGGFASAYAEITPVAQWLRTTWLYEYAFLESLATMLLGIALYAAGALQGRWSARRYAALALAGYAVGLPVSGWEAWTVVRSGFDVLAIESTWLRSYELGRVPLTLGHAGLILWLWKIGAFARTLRRLSAVGRMAFTNYLAQSLLAMLVFTGVGLGLFGQLERAELYLFVAAVWAVQLAWSPWWLARFRYGPAEWAWRSLVYARRQPFRRAAGGGPRGDGDPRSGGGPQSGGGSTSPAAGA